MTAAVQHTTFFQNVQITPVCKSDEGLHLDRLDVMEILIYVGAKFDTALPANSILQFERVPDVVRYLSDGFFADGNEAAYARLSQRTDDRSMAIPISLRRLPHSLSTFFFLNAPAATHAALGVEDWKKLDGSGASGNLQGRH